MWSNIVAFLLLKNRVTVFWLMLIFLAMNCLTYVITMFLKIPN